MATKNKLICRKKRQGYTKASNNTRSKVKSKNYVVGRSSEPMKTKHKVKHPANDASISIKKATPIIPSRGLTLKETSFIVNSCPTKSERYKLLQTAASDAINNNKIFSIYGNSKGIKNALKSRGWVERVISGHMNLGKLRSGKISTTEDVKNELERLFLSHLVERYRPSFIWNAYPNSIKCDIEDPEQKVVHNVITTNNKWTTKEGLCLSIKNQSWFYMKNKAYINFPRTFTSYGEGELQAFIDDYRFTASTNLLKWFVKNIKSNEYEGLFSTTGNISINVLQFALAVCKKYLSNKKCEDIDVLVSKPPSFKWKSFLLNYNQILNHKDTFKTCERENVENMVSVAECVLEEVSLYRPQLYCEGYNNIWIVKPSDYSRGRGIKVMSNIESICQCIKQDKSCKYIVQKYIESPLLIYGTKFDIRFYYVMTKTYPLEIWVYKKYYLKFSSQNYTLDNFHESVHLTNNAVQKKYKLCSDRHASLPDKNMWDSDTFKEYLDQIGKSDCFEDVINKGMKECILGVMLTCQDNLPIVKNRFELYGCDFILDEKFKPWIIEINSSPDMKPTTPVTAKICPMLLEDLIKVVVDRNSNPTSSTGYFECIYKQTMTWPHYGAYKDFMVKGSSINT